MANETSDAVIGKVKYWKALSNRVLLPGEALPNQRIGWCCIDRLSRPGKSGLSKPECPNEPSDSQ